MQSAKTRLGTDCGSDHELLIAKFRLKLKRVGKATRPFRNDLNQIPYNYTVEVRNRFKGLYLIDSSVQSLSHVRLFVTPWTAAQQASLSITNSLSLLKLTSIESVIPSNHLILSSQLQSFPASGSFQIIQFFPSGGQSIGVSASASVLPMNTLD